MNRHDFDCPTALVLFKITHQDRAGETGTLVQKQGEVVAMNRDGQAIIAAESGEIILAPADALHPVTGEMAAGCASLAGCDFAVAAELVRWFPAQTEPFTLRWLAAEEIVRLLRDAKITSQSDPK